MDSEDDMFDADSSYSYEEEEDNSYINAADDNYDAVATAPVSDHRQDFTFLTENDIRVRQQDDISRISTLLSIPTDFACTLLTHYNWNVNKVHEQWFSDEQSVRKTVGLFESESPSIVMYNRKKKRMECGICFDSYFSDGIVNTSCGHPFCNACWTTYISTSINDGRGCLSLKCPAPDCSVAVCRDMIDMLVSDGDKEKYCGYLVRSYVEDNYRKNTKWCPGPGCNFAVEYDLGSERSSYDVSCVCLHEFCWNCGEDAHRPVDCDTVSKWVLKNRDESGNTTWMLANTKPCPKCKRAIEKNQGCNHMTCKSPCNFQFCWLCLGNWSEHRDHYACNRYRAAEDNKREIAKKFIERYTHYYERWVTNEKSRKKALADLEIARDVHVKQVADDFCETLGQLGFIEQAWIQIAECRRVLKWTYAYGYYIPEKEGAKKKFFEYLQGEAEAGLERLHHCAEKELLNYLVISKANPPGDFNDFRTKLVDLTTITRNYFENLVTALQNDLSEVDQRENLVTALQNDLSEVDQRENLVTALQNDLSEVDQREVVEKK